MNTPMMELIEEWKPLTEHEDQSLRQVAEEFIKSATELLEKEKHMVIDAYTDGCNEGLSFTGKKLIKTAEDYYNQKYKS